MATLVFPGYCWAVSSSHRDGYFQLTKARRTQLPERSIRLGIDPRTGVRGCPRERYGRESLQNRQPRSASSSSGGRKRVWSCNIIQLDNRSNRTGTTHISCSNVLLTPNLSRSGVELAASTVTKLPSFWPPSETSPSTILIPKPASL